MTRVYLVLLFIVMMVAAGDCTCSNGFCDDQLHYGKFPDDFLWGSATSAYQIEGGWNADGKSESIWDHFVRQKGHVANGETGDIACDSYHLYMEDVRILKEMKAKHYRFSIAWTRIIPDPRTGQVNQAGIDYYNKVINALVQEHIVPMVTLYHWDLPQVLHEYGGWCNETMVDYFKHFADVAFSHFGDRVKHWITFNEPWVVSFLGYGVGIFAPGVKDQARGPYKVAHTIIKAHAATWHLYDKTYRPKQKGMVSITLNSGFKAPKDPNNKSDVEAADRALQFFLGWFANPIYKNGDYPEVMKRYVARKSHLQGLNESRLPSFTDAEKKYINGTWDFFGLNQYTAQYFVNKDTGISNPGWGGDQDTMAINDPKWRQAASSWLYFVPWSIRGILNWIKKEYNNPPVLITENGWSDKTGTLHDHDRIEYYRDYTNNVLKAIQLDSCHVIGYTAWSLMDNFEWASGYTEKFGMYYIDFSDPNKRRVPKDSSKFYHQLIVDNAFLQTRNYTHIIPVG